jgi:hypothetical protein
VNATRFLLITAASPAAALAQPFVIQSHTFDSGGATALAAGPYALGGTIGQSDAGTLVAGAFECQGGFWNAGSAAAACYADCDGAGGLTANDFICFLGAYNNGASYANCDGVGGLTANDFICFVSVYNGGARDYFDFLSPRAKIDAT